MAVACPEKLGGGGGAQSNFPTCDHSLFEVICTLMKIFRGEGGPMAMYEYSKIEQVCNK